MPDQICKCCGQTLPPPFEIGLKLAPGPRRLLDAIYLAGEYGITTERLIDKSYCDDPNGGPEYARKTIHVRICKLNKQLRPRGWVITGRDTHNGTYILKKLLLPPDEAADVICAALAAA